MIYEEARVDSVRDAEVSLGLFVAQHSRGESK